MSPMMRPMAESFRFTHFIMGLVTGDLTQKQAIRRARGGQGASIAWIVGHLLHYRCQILELLGGRGSDEFAARFGSAGASDGSDYPDISQLRARWDQLHGELETVMAAVTNERLTTPVDDPTAPHSEKTALDLLAFYMWHESYHMGALGMLRTDLGLPPTAQLAVQAKGATAT